VKAHNESPQVAFRASPALVERLDRLADAMARTDGIGAKRSVAIRRLVLVALPLLESQHGIDQKVAS
jgi:hypothetical protein